MLCPCADQESIKNDQFRGHTPLMCCAASSGMTSSGGFFLALGESWPGAKIQLGWRELGLARTGVDLTGGYMMPDGRPLSPEGNRAGPGCAPHTGTEGSSYHALVLPGWDGPVQVHETAGATPASRPIADRSAVTVRASLSTRPARRHRVMPRCAPCRQACMAAGRALEQCLRIVDVIGLVENQQIDGRLHMARVGDRTSRGRVNPILRRTSTPCARTT